MNPTDQVEMLSQTTHIPSFDRQVMVSKQSGVTARQIKIFQINVGKRCNLQCAHCHVEAGPHRTEMMSRETFEQCLGLIQHPLITTVDLTGGAPELNPHLGWFIEQVSPLQKRVIVRSNLTVLTTPKYAVLMDLFARYNVEIVASLPCYLEANTDQQRGTHVFQQSIQILRELNRRGYGQAGSGRVLNLVHNPIGASLAPDQAELEAIYKQVLQQDYGVAFNQLFCMTNLPVSRFLDALLATGEYEHYMSLLASSFNPATVEHVMCTDTISVSWDGRLYDCDFNQMLELPVSAQGRTLAEFSYDQLNGRSIVVNNHCYGCTAGAGTSCQGAL